MVRSDIFHHVNFFAIVFNPTNKKAVALSLFPLLFSNCRIFLSGSYAIRPHHFYLLGEIRQICLMLLPNFYQIKNPLNESKSKF